MRFDHAVVAVRDLAAASERLRDAGFDVREGGRHIGFGTENAIVRFGLDYVELIAVHDEATALRASARSAALAQFVRAHESGLVGYALATDDLEDVARRLRSVGQEVEGPTRMSRQRPDGIVLEWRLVIPGGVAWRRAWPFFIDWGLPDEVRLTVETPRSHANGANGVRRVSIAVEDVPSAIVLYEAVLGAARATESRRAVFILSGVEIEIVAINDAAQRPGLGEGLYELGLRVGPGVGPSLLEPLRNVRFVLT